MERLFRESKTSFYIIFLILTASALMFSCGKDEEGKPLNGTVSFAFGDNNITNGRTTQVAKSLIVSVKDQNGNVVLERKKLELLKFGEEYISEPLALGVGDFKLTEFLVVDENSIVLYATPLEGSALAHLVADPLPINFSVKKDQVTKIITQVVSVEAGTGLDFGYATFAFDVIDTFHFQIGVLVYDEVSSNFKLTTSDIKISQNGADVLVDTLPAITNRITLKDNDVPYVIKIQKSNYEPFEKMLTIDELKQFTDSVLVVKLVSQSLDSGLIASYPFNGNSLDQTNNHYNGVVHGATLTADRNGIANSAYSFNGADSYIAIPHNNAFNFTATDLTISFWVKVSATQNNANGSINDIIRKWTGDAQGYPFAISYIDNSASIDIRNKILLARYDGSGCANVPNMYSVSTIDINFHHIIFMKKAGKIYLYIDGIKVTEVNDTTSCSVSNTVDVTIGARGNLVRYFTGKIDDIRFYNRALTDSEIGTLAHI